MERSSLFGLSSRLKLRPHLLFQKVDRLLHCRLRIRLVDPWEFAPANPSIIFHLIGDDVEAGRLGVNCLVDLDSHMVPSPKEFCGLKDMVDLVKVIAVFGEDTVHGRLQGFGLRRRRSQDRLLEATRPGATEERINSITHRASPQDINLPFNDHPHPPLVNVTGSPRPTIKRDWTAARPLASIAMLCGLGIQYQPPGTGERSASPSALLTIGINGRSDPELAIGGSFGPREQRAPAAGPVR